MKTKLFSLLLALLILTTAFTGCFPTDNIPDDTTTEAIPDETTAEPAPQHEYDYGTFTGKFTCNGLGIYNCTCQKCGEAAEVYKEVPEEELPAHTSVDGTTVMFVGNSFVYYGYAIMNGGQGGYDQGYFYQICKKNGEDVKVLDYVYGGKNLDYIYTNNMPKDPEKYKDVDYVFMSEAGENNKNIVADCKQIMDLCGEDTQFYYLCHLYTVSQGHSNITGAFDALRALGCNIVNWGQLAYDVWKGTAKIEGSELTYNKNSFVVNKQDSHHQNMLSGYITAQMAYCAITGKSAVGQDYSFCTDTSINSKFNPQNYMAEYYTKNGSEYTTNFDKAFASPTDMLGFQKLMDEYLVKYEALPEAFIKRGSHLYDDIDELLSIGSSNFCGIQIRKCRYCHDMLAGETLSLDNTHTNKIFVSFNLQNAAGESSIESYINNGRGIFKNANNGAWSSVGVSSISNLYYIIEGRRGANKNPINSCAVITLEGTEAKYDISGASGSDYVGLVDIEFNAPQSFAGYSILLANDGALNAYDIIGGTKNADGSISWKVLSSHSGELAGFDDYTDCMVGNFSSTSIDIVRIGFKDVTSPTIHISEFELYN